LWPAPTPQGLKPAQILDSFVALKRHASTAAPAFWRIFSSLAKTRLFCCMAEQAAEKCGLLDERQNPAANAELISATYGMPEGIP
jgi:hypothetical protein